MEAGTGISALRRAMELGGARRECGVLPTPLGPLRLGAVHEWFGERGWSPPLCVLADLARRALSASAVCGVVWVGRGCWPWPVFLPREVVGASVFVDPPDAGSRLWCVDVACRCERPAAVIADGRGLTLAQTRRLQLAAGSGGGLCLLARAGSERAELSASATRWSVSPAPGEGVGRPRWSVALLRNKDLPALTEERPSLVVEWDHAEGGLRVAADVGDRASPACAGRAAS